MWTIEQVRRGIEQEIIKSQQAAEESLRARGRAEALQALLNEMQAEAEAAKPSVEKPETSNVVKFKKPEKKKDHGTDPTSA